jgi:pimeloyl-ACP methyl ester carboxylesterase
MKHAPLLHYEIEGTGPAVLLLHGYMGSGRYWGRVRQELSTTHRVITLDLLGFGRSPKPRFSRYDLQAQRRSIEATLAALKINEPLTVIGHSMGSLIALDFAWHHADRLERLVLANMPVFASTREAKRDIYGTRPLYRFALQPGLHAIIWPLFKASLLFTARRRGQQTGRHLYMMQSSRFARIRSMRNLIFKAGVEARLAALEVRTTLVSGAFDRAVYLHNLQRFEMGTMVHSLIVDGGHHLPLTHPRAIVRALHDA